MEYLNLQISSLLILLGTGWFLGAFFDLYRVLRCRIRRNFFTDLIGDLVFWLLALLGAGLLIYWGTWLELRLYVWLITAIGLALYFSFFSPVLIPLFLRFWQAVGWLPRQVAKGVWHTRIMARKAGWLVARKNRLPKRKKQGEKESS